jgi:hypothetical protein
MSLIMRPNWFIIILFTLERHCLIIA